MAAAHLDTPEETSEIELPPLTDGEMATAIGIRVITKKTAPPKRYTEDSLLGDMESASKFLEDTDLAKVLKRVAGLGTPATRAEIIEGLKHDKYLALQGKELHAAPKGVALIDWLPPGFYDVARTAQLETALDGIVSRQIEAPQFFEALESDLNNRLDELKGANVGALRRFLNFPTPERSTTAMSTEQPSPPTPKMASFAQSLSAKLNVALPPDALVSFDACKAFLDEHSKSLPPSPPSQKQLSFANSIAQKKKVQVPAAALKSSAELSKWIDNNK